jgi:hypothetical protein
LKHETDQTAGAVAAVSLLCLQQEQSQDVFASAVADAFCIFAPLCIGQSAGISADIFSPLCIGQESPVQQSQQEVLASPVEAVCFDFIGQESPQHDMAVAVPVELRLYAKPATPSAITITAATINNIFLFMTFPQYPKNISSAVNGQLKTR